MDAAAHPQPVRMRMRIRNVNAPVHPQPVRMRMRMRNAQCASAAKVALRMHITDAQCNSAPKTALRMHNAQCAMRNATACPLCTRWCEFTPEAVKSACCTIHSTHCTIEPTTRLHLRNTQYAVHLHLKIEVLSNAQTGLKMQRLPNAERKPYHP